MFVAIDCPAIGTIVSTIGREVSSNEAWIAIGLPGPIKPPGIGRGVPSSASGLAVRS